MNEHKMQRVTELEEQLAQAERDGEQFCQRITELETIARALIFYGKMGAGQLTHIVAAAELAMPNLKVP